MKIHFASDIHLEFAKYRYPNNQLPDADVYVYAGDIGTGLMAFHWFAFAEQFSHKPQILYVPGNHEYYNQSFVDMQDRLVKGADLLPNVTLLNGAVTTHGNVTFIGFTLWTDFNDHNPLNMMVAERGMNDFYQIAHFGVEFAYHINQQARKLIFDEIAKAREIGNKVVVVTHHSPILLKSRNNLDYAFHNTGLENMIADNGPDLWIHGHTHECLDYMVGNTRIMSNQLGYPHEEGIGFDPNLVVEV